MSNLCTPFIVGLILLSSCQSVESSKAVRYSETAVTEAVPFAEGVISTKDNSEFSLMFSPDGLTAYFSRRAPEEKQRIYRTEFSKGGWTEPVLCPFSTDRDESPSISPDGELFFFGSERPIPDQPNLGNFDMNIWMMKRTPEGWSVPEPLPSPINEVQIEGEEWPSSNNNFLFALNDSTFYYTTMKRGTSAIKLFETTYKNSTFSEPEEVKGLFDNDSTWVYSAVVSPDGEYLVFNSYGVSGGAGGEDLFVSKRLDDGWSKAKPLASINSANEESGPRFSRDGNYFFFTTAENLGNHEYSDWDIYYIETAYLELEKLFE